MILPPLELPLIEQIALEHSTVPRDEASPCVLGNLFCGTGVVQNDLREDIVRPAAYSEIHVVLDLTRNYICVRALGGKNEVDTKRPPQPRNRCKPALDLRQQFLVPFAPSCSVKHLCHLVTAEHQPGKVLSRGLVVGVKVGTSRFRQKSLALL